MTGCDAEPAQRYERVASPISEPRVTGNKGFSFAALDEVCVSGTFERTGEILPAALLNRPDLGMTRFDGFDVGDRVSFSREHQHRRPACNAMRSIAGRFFGKGKFKNSGRGAISKNF